VIREAAAFAIYALTGSALVLAGMWMGHKIRKDSHK